MEDWSVCRLCLQTSEVLKDVSQITYNMIPFWNLYFEIFRSTFKDYDAFPGKVCTTCEYDIIHAYKFRERCLETEDKLKELLEDSNSGTNVEVIPELFVVNVDEDESVDKTNFPNDREPEELPACPVKRDSIKKDKFDNMEHLKNTVIKCKKCLESVMGIELFKKHRCSRIEDVTVMNTAIDNLVKEKSKYKKKEKPKNKIFKCQKCPREFRCQSGLVYHNDQHENHKRFICEHCGKGFVDWSTRRSHIYRAHLKKKLFYCHHCERGYYKKYYLSKHIETAHLKKREYQCEICGMKFSASNTMKVHFQIHKKGGACDICGKVLKNARTLKKHKELHSGLKNYVCKVCDMAFTCNWSLKNHIRKKHPDKVHLIPPDGTIVNKKYLENLEKYDLNID
ncbi:zinc finger protein 2 homolog [Sergentomyia squamirostris]